MNIVFLKHLTLHVKCAALFVCEDFMTKNITLRMDEEVLRSFKHIAVEHDMSVSAWITQAALDAATKETKLERVRYEKVRTKALKVLEKKFHLGGDAFDRESCYDRFS